MDIPKNCVKQGRKHLYKHLSNGDCVCSICGQSCGEILEYKVVDNSLLPIVVQKGLDNPKGYHPRCRDGRLPCRLATVCASFKPKKKELHDKVEKAVTELYADGKPDIRNDVGTVLLPQHAKTKLMSM